MKQRSDFELEPPSSLREIIEDELRDAVDEDLRRGREVKPIEDVDQLMQKVYAHIEKQALLTYHSSAPWALRMWALSNILKEEIVNEATAEVAHGLISDIITWQQEQEFDPLAYFADQIQDLSPKSIKGYLLTASRFVGFIGRKRYYPDEDVISYLKYARKRYDNDNTYQQEGIRLLQFLRALGDDNRKLPGKKSKGKIRKKYVYAVPIEDLEKIVWACVLDNIRYDMVLRLLCATIVKHAIKSDLDTHKFMRWAEPRELGILAQYDQTRYEDVDKLVLDNHPMVKVWETACPYILKFNRSYKPFYDYAH